MAEHKDYIGSCADDNSSNNCSNNIGTCTDDNSSNNYNNNIGTCTDDNSSNNCNDNIGTYTDDNDNSSNNCNDNIGTCTDDNSSNNCNNNIGTYTDDNDNSNNICSDIKLLSNSGLQQHIHGTTHKKGHSLDFLITRDVDPPAIGDISITAGISDHSAILEKMHMQRLPVQKKS